MHILVAGLGAAGRRHITNLRFLRQDLDLTVLSAEGQVVVGDASVLRLVGRVEDALAVRPDAAIIANSSHRHHDLLAPLLAASIPCYIEKPIVTTRAQARALHATLTHLSRVPITLSGCNLRYLPSLIKLRELVRGGAAGRIVRASLQAGQWLPDWRAASDYRSSYRAQRESGGGVILDLIHELDQARWLFGEFQAVLAMAGHLSTLEISSEDVACVLLGNPGVPPMVSVALDYVSRRRVRRYEIVGEEATLVWDLDAARLERVDAAGRELIDCGPDGFNVALTYRAAISEFVTCVGNGTPTSQDIWDGLASVDLALRAGEAAGL